MSYEFRQSWCKYDRIGKQVPGTSFIPFKTPMKETNKANNTDDVPEHHRLYPKLLMDLEPKIGLVIDLTKTRYYPNSQLLERGVKHVRIKLPTNEVPSYQLYQEFRETVKKFLQRGNGKLIGVHGKHGINRAGYMICRYMIEEMGIRPQQAISDFQKARGAGIEHQHFIDALMSYQPRLLN